MLKTGHLYMPEDHMEELYSSKNPLVRFVHAGRLEAIAREMPSETSLSVLDAGCGEGHLLEKLHEHHPQHRYHGIDVTDTAVQRAKIRCPFARIQKANFVDTGCRAGEFDAVVCTETLEHVYEYERALREFKRILKPGGQLILTFPNEALWTAGRFLLGRRPVKVPDHVNAFTPERMKHVVRLEWVKQVNLPLGLPFFLSLNALMIFRKAGL